MREEGEKKTSKNPLVPLHLFNVCKRNLLFELTLIFVQEQIKKKGRTRT